MKALVENGPMSVSFEVYDDFMMYKSGVYHHTGALKSKQSGASFNPFEVSYSPRVAQLQLSSPADKPRGAACRLRS